MNQALPFLVVLLASSAAADQKQANDWRETELIAEKDLLVRFKVRAVASLADSEWMALEFENRGAKPLTVSNAYYWIRAEYGRLGSGTSSGFGSLASGNTYDLFPDAWATTPISAIVLQPGMTYRSIEQPSTYSAALLGASPAGRSVRGKIFLAMSLGDGRQLRVAEPRGTPFEFDWPYPDQAGFAVLRSRLGQLLQTPKNFPHHSYILGAYLGIPEIARAAKVEDLLAALTLRRQAFEGRPEIAAHLARHFPKQPAVIAYYRQRLIDGDRLALDDLRHAALWAPAFVPLLLDMYEANPLKCAAALDVLHTHRDDWRKDSAVCQRLSTAVQRAYPIVLKDVGRLEKRELERWADAVLHLSMTGDMSVIPRLRPILDDETTFRSTKRMALAWGIRVPPLRICDVALDAILTLLEGSPDAAYRRAGPAPADNLDAGYAALRDRMRTALRKRLADRDD